MRWRIPGWSLGVSRDDYIQKALRSLATAEGEQFRLSPKTGRLVPVTRGSSGPGGFSQHGARLLAGGAVDVVVAEEDLRGGGVGGAVLGHVVRVEVDGRIGGFLNELDTGGLAVGAGSGGRVRSEAKRNGDPGNLLPIRRHKQIFHQLLKLMEVRV